MIKFASIHNHDGFSLLDGLGTAKEYIKACKERGIYAFGITNHGNTASVLEYYEEGKKQNFKTLLGQEFYIEESEIVYDVSDKKKNLNRYYHLIVLAKNNIGYKNLLKLSSLGFEKDRFYYRPRITFDDLFNNKEGLIVTSACCAGPVAKNIWDGNLDKAFYYSRKFKEELGSDWYLEIELIDISWDWDNKEKEFKRQDSNAQELINREIIKIGSELDISVIIGLDAHMINEDDKIIQDVAIKISNKTGWHFYDTYYLKTVDEIWDDCQQLHPTITREQFEQFCDNTVEIADKCDVELDFKIQLPEVKKDPQKLYKIIQQKNKINWSDSRYVERLKYEINVICNNGVIDLLDYFYVLVDLVDWCEDNGIVVGPGRGCITGEAKVLTNRGYIDLKDIIIGDKVCTHKGRFLAVLDTMKFPCTDNLIEIESSYGFKNIRMTKYHLVYAQKRVETKICDKNKECPSWIPAGELRVGDLIFSPWIKRKIKKSEHSNEYFYWMGYWIGNGFIKLNNETSSYILGFSFHSDNKKMIKKCLDYWRMRGINVDRILYSKKTKLSQVLIYSKELVLEYSRIFKDDIDDDSRYIPDCFKYAEDEKILALREGIIDSDRSGVEDKISYNTVSSRLAYDYRELCLFLKDLTHVSISNKNKISYNLMICKYSSFKNNDGYFSPIIKLNKVRCSEVYDITVDKDSSYLTQNYAVHNSACGSLLAYALGVTAIDPIKYDLLFERFLSLPRIQEGSLPDIDLDFSNPDAAKNYLRAKYGEDRVYSIGTIQQIKIKQAWTDVCRVILGDDFNYQDNKILSRGLPSTNPDANLVLILKGIYEGYLSGDVIKKDNDILVAIDNGVSSKSFDPDYNKKWINWINDKKNPQGKQIYEIMLKILGLPRQTGIHACFSGDMRVYTDEGYKTFRELNNETVNVLTTHGFQQAKIFVNGYRDLYLHNIKSSYFSNISKKITNTEDHTFLDDSDKGYGTLNEINSFSLLNHKDFDDSFVLAGWIWNDGHYDKNNENYHLYYTVGKDDEILELLEPTQFRTVSGREDNLVLNKNFSNKIFENIEYCKEKTFNKCFPFDLRKKELKKRISWLRGFFSANATVVRKEIRLKISSQKLINEIKGELNLLGFDIKTKIGVRQGKKIKFSNGTYQCKDFYELILNQDNCLLFGKLIGFIQTYKQEKLNGFISYYKVFNKSYCGKDYVYDFSIIDSDSEPNGLIEGFWAHNCAMAVSKEPINNLIPTAVNKGVPVTQFTAEWCEKAGIIKYDILGLNTLKDFQECLVLIKSRYGTELNIYDLDTNDPKVLSEFEKGNTDTVFQFNTQLQKKFLKDVGIKSLLDLAVVTAISRPGPLSSGVSQSYVNRKNGSEVVHYDHEKLKEVTEQYYGTMIFQEQIMKFFNVIGGLSLVESERVRKALGKKKINILKEYEPRYLEYATTKLDPPLSGVEAQKLWHTVENYCKYSFCKSHAVAYSYVAYVCQYFKTYYPMEWWCSVLMNCDNEDFKEFYKICPIETSLPDINESQGSFYLNKQNKIIIPFTKIKSVGEKATFQITKTQPYKSFEDFVERVNKTTVKKNVIVNLVFAGCFDKLHPEIGRVELLERYFEIRKKKHPKEEFPKIYQKLDKEKLLNFESVVLEFRSINYLELFGDHFGSKALTYELIRQIPQGHGVITGGKVLKKYVRKTKRGTQYCQMYLHNDNDKIKVTFWRLEHKDMYKPVKEGDVILVKGDVAYYGGNIDINGKFLEIIINIEEKEN